MISYLFGSIPFGQLLGRKIGGIDITKQGSGNIGATNVAREIGLKWGALTLLLDMIKGVIPIAIFSLISPGGGVRFTLVGLAALIGHQFSIFRGFRGGKGIATAFGIYLIIAPLPSLTALLLFLLTVSLSGFVSLGSIISAAVMPLLIWLAGKPLSFIVVSSLITALICFKHGDNIQRLLRGQERRWGKRRLRSGDREADPVHRQKKNG